MKPPEPAPIAFQTEPGRAAEAMPLAGTLARFDARDTPATQSFGLLAALRASPQRATVILFTALLGTLATLAVFLGARSWDERAAVADFQGKAKTDLQIVQAELAAAGTLMATYQAFFEASDRAVTGPEFKRFSQALHGHVVGLRDTGWAPRVTRAQRRAFEQRMQSAGLQHFQILERSGSGLVRAGDRAEYYPILYLDSGAAARRVLGLDLASEPTRQAAIARALKTGRPAATPPIDLVTIQRPRGGAMAFAAVGATPPGVATGGPVPRNRGVALGVIDFDKLLDNILTTRVPLASVDVHLFDPAGRPGERLIYRHAARRGGGADPGEAALLGGPHLQGTVSMLDQRWSIVFTPSEPLDPLALNWHTCMPLAVGLAMTAMIVAYLLLSLRRTLQLEQLSAELHRKTETLHRHAEQIAHMARHDTLTGLPNRALFRDRLQTAILQLQRGESFALLCLDLDRFKAVNDTLGHGAGDKVLLQVAARLKAGVREVDTVARVGGDEFAVLMPDIAGAADAERVARRLVQSLLPHCELGRHTASVGLSVGIALAPADGSTAEDLLNRADQALYAAKAAGRGRHCFYGAQVTG